LFEIVAPATANVVIREIKIGQYTDFGDMARTKSGLDGVGF
jgi:hypothetical protein